MSLPARTPQARLLQNTQRVISFVPLLDHGSQGIRGPEESIEKVAAEEDQQDLLPDLHRHDALARGHVRDLYIVVEPYFARTLAERCGLQRRIRQHVCA